MGDVSSKMTNKQDSQNPDSKIQAAETDSVTQTNNSSESSDNQNDPNSEFINSELGSFWLSLDSELLLVWVTESVSAAWILESGFWESCLFVILDDTSPTHKKSIIILCNGNSWEILQHHWKNTDGMENR